MILALVTTDAAWHIGLGFLAFCLFVWGMSRSERHAPSPEPEPFPYEHRAYGREPVQNEQVGIVSAEHSAWKKAA